MSTQLAAGGHEERADREEQAEEARVRQDGPALPEADERDVLELVHRPADARTCSRAIRGLCFRVLLASAEEFATVDGVSITHSSY